jgi:HEAT repeat protein
VGRLIADTALVLALASAACSAPQAREAPVLVHALGEFPAELDGRIQGSTGQRTPVEQRREALYVELRRLGDAAIPALRSGLADPDVHVRRNVALYLTFEGGNYAKHAAAGLDVAPFVPQLVAALRDEDERVMELAAQALEHAGLKAASAVPDLIRLVEHRSEAVRNSACIGLAGIGPAAREALPVLRRALDDPSKDVKHFARRAIGKIERPEP